MDAFKAESKKILVTGANGFVGTVLCRALLSKQFSVCAVVRSAQKKNDLLNLLKAPSSLLECLIENKLENDPVNLTDNIDTIVHLAARVHMMRDDAADPLTEYRRVNVSMTENLALAAAAAGVRRFIYLSSIKVNGEFTLPNNLLLPA